MNHCAAVPRNDSHLQNSIHARGLWVHFEGVRLGEFWVNSA